MLQEAFKAAWKAGRQSSIVNRITGQVEPVGRSTIELVVVILLIR